MTHLNADEHLHVELVAGRTLAPVAAHRVVTGGCAARLTVRTLVLVHALARVVALHVALRTGARGAPKHLLPAGAAASQYILYTHCTSFDPFSGCAQPSYAHHSHHYNIKQNVETEARFALLSSIYPYPYDNAYETNVQLLKLIAIRVG